METKSQGLREKFGWSGNVKQSASSSLSTASKSFASVTEEQQLSSSEALQSKFGDEKIQSIKSYATHEQLGSEVLTSEQPPKKERLIKIQFESSSSGLVNTERTIPIQVDQTKKPVFIEEENFEDVIPTIDEGVTPIKTIRTIQIKPLKVCTQTEYPTVFLETEERLPVEEIAIENVEIIERQEISDLKIDETPASISVVTLPEAQDFFSTFEDSENVRFDNETKMDFESLGQFDDDVGVIIEELVDSNDELMNESFPDDIPPELLSSSDFVDENLVEDFVVVEDIPKPKSEERIIPIQIVKEFYHPVISSSDITSNDDQILSRTIGREGAEVRDHKVTSGLSQREPDHPEDEDVYWRIKEKVKKKKRKPKEVELEGNKESKDVEVKVKDEKDIQSKDIKVENENDKQSKQIEIKISQQGKEVKFKEESRDIEIKIEVEKDEQSEKAKSEEGQQLMEVEKSKESRDIVIQVEIEKGKQSKQIENDDSQQAKEVKLEDIQESRDIEIKVEVEKEEKSKQIEIVKSQQFKKVEGNKESRDIEIKVEIETDEPKQVKTEDDQQFMEVEESKESRDIEVKLNSDDDKQSPVAEYEMKDKDKTHKTSDKEVLPRKTDQDKNKSKTEVEKEKTQLKSPFGGAKVKKEKQLRLSHEMFWINKLEREETEKALSISKIRKTYLVSISLSKLLGD